MAPKTTSGDASAPMLAAGPEDVSTNHRLHELSNCQPNLKNKRKSLMLFERASHTWWNPQFASNILEKQYFGQYFPAVRNRFRWGLAYAIITILAWWVYRVATYPWSQIMAHQLGAIAILLVFAMILLFTFNARYHNFYISTSIISAFLICTLSLLYCSINPPVISPVGAFATSVAVLFMLYTIIPMPLYACVGVGVCYSILFDIIRAQFGEELFGVKLLLHLCIHIIGVHIFIITQVRTRKTFLKIGESLMARRDLAIERWIKEQMIISVMPPKVADELMGTNIDDTNRRSSVGPSSNRAVSALPPALLSTGRQPPAHKGRKSAGVAFRPFTMNLMKDVSILFADIAGFTKMSSNKTAEELVDLLNDLFGRFDRLCNQLGCEKISTLGDCYYCVAGCPEPKPDHAICCVDMGMAMVTAIRQFDEDRGQEVNMRVGVHTGTVMCGIVGTRRFKFDVFSNDVTLANTMESSGRAGWVHISEATAGFLDNQFELEDGELCEGLKTYFIVKKLGETSPPLNQAALKPGISWNGNEKSLTGDGSQGEKDQKSWSPDASPANSNLKRVGKIQSSDALASPNSLSLPPRGGSLRTQLLAGNVANSPSQHSQAPGQEPRRFVSVSQLLVNDRDTTSLAELVSEMRQANRAGGAMDSLTGGISRIDDRTDRRLAECWKENEDTSVPATQDIMKPLSLRFRKPELEKNYQSHFARRRDSEQQKTEMSALTAAEKEDQKRKQSTGQDEKVKHQRVSAPKYSVLVDIFVASGVYLLIAVCIFIAFGGCISWVAYFAAVTPLLLVFLALLLWHIIRFRSLLGCLTLWTPRQFIGILCIELPVGALAALFCSETRLPLVVTNSSTGDLLLYDASDRTLLIDSQQLQEPIISQQLTLCYAVIILLCAHCNFSQLNNLLKSFFATVIGLVLIVLANICLVSHCRYYEALATNLSYTNSADSDATRLLPIFSGVSPYRFEVVLDVLLILILIVYLNRHFETIFRISFYGDWQSVHDIEQMQQMKEQADWLLENIIPSHVMDKLKSDSRYSENHDQVAVIFAAITNWGDMYEESFEGGREFLRVLNELIADFDDLMDRPEFNEVEKIKTIGPTYMAASGLNTEKRRASGDPKAHLYQLMEFALAVQETLQAFNNELLNFEFVMKIGLNIGPVTAGVIGTTKLYYDIWGDTVNIASRMYSTGVKGKIQVSKHVVNIIGDRYDFDFRDHVEVKGIDGGMDVFLFKGHKPLSLRGLPAPASDANSTSASGQDKSNGQAPAIDESDTTPMLHS